MGVTAAMTPQAVPERIAEARAQVALGNVALGLELFRKAADTEAALLYTEPPSYPRPVVEGFANTAIAMGDFATAEKAYPEALAREPGSGRAYFGLAAALKAQNKTADAQSMTMKAMKAWDKADPDLPQMRATSHTAGVQR